MERALRGEPQVFERTIHLPNGTDRQVLAEYLPDYQGNEVIGFFVVVTDISEIKRLDQERQLMAAKMINSSKLSSLGEMAGSIAHEINTPLAVIISKADLILEYLSLGQWSESETLIQIEKIKLTAERISKIVKGLRLFSRNSENDPFKPFSMATVIESTLDLCQERLLGLGIKLVLEIEKDLQVSGRLPEISQVLLNLINNSADAIEHMPNPWIKIQASRIAGKCILTVMDSGQGISQEVAEKMMNPFFTTKELGRGTGLGLSISSGIIKSHGGKLWYDGDSPNTTFVIEFPLAEANQKGNVA